MLLKIVFFALCWFNIVQRSTANVCAPLNKDYNIRYPPFVQRVTESFDHAEEPTWDAKRQLLFFVDIYKALVNSYDPVTHELNSVYLDGANESYQVKPILTTDEPNQFVVGLTNSLAYLEWDGRNCTPANLTIFATVDQTKPGNRFNDGKADVYGRLWIGTMGPLLSTGIPDGLGTFYRFDKSDPTVGVSILQNESVPNGLTWSPDNTKFYLVETPDRKVYAYDFDKDAATISNREVAFDFANYDIGGEPDGMTIDSEGNLFVAVYGGGVVIKVNPTTGELLQTIAIPAQFVTSTMFGGKDLDILFVTTSRQHLTSAELATQPHAGSLFAVYLNDNQTTRGIPTFNAKLF